MIRLAKIAFWFWVGHSAVTQLAPIVQAKLEAMDLDEMWDVFNAEA